MRSDDHVFTVLGAENNWEGFPLTGQRSPATQRQAAPIRVHMGLICVDPFSSSAVRRAKTWWEVWRGEKSAVFACFLECRLMLCTARLHPARSSLQQEEDGLVAGRNPRSGSHTDGGGSQNPELDFTRTGAAWWLDLKTQGVPDSGATNFLNCFIWCTDDATHTHGWLLFLYLYLILKTPPPLDFSCNHASWQ